MDFKTFFFNNHAFAKYFTKSYLAAISYGIFSLKNNTSYFSKGVAFLGSYFFVKFG